MPRIVKMLASVLLLGGAASVSAQELSRTQPPPEYTTTPAEYTTTPSRYTTTPSPYLPLPDTVPPDFGQENNGTGNDPYADNTGEEDPTQSDSMASRSNVELVARAYAQYALGLDDTSVQQFLDDFTRTANQLGYQTEEVSLEMGVQIALYLTLSRSLGISVGA